MFSGKCTIWLTGGAGIASLVFAILCGCSRSAPAPKSDEFFTGWLQAHGESNVVVDAQGVGVAGNATRLRYSLYGSEQHTNGDFSAELEFKVRMPDRREIVEYVSGSGGSLEKAEGDAKVNFVVTTFHVVYRGFINTNDSHQTEEKVTIGGQPRLLVMGDTMARAQSTNDTPNLLPMRDQIRKALGPLPFSPQTHWIKIIYANHHSKTMMCAVTLDNGDDAQLTDAIKNLPWPKQEAFYMVKQFIVVK